jgi:hypothetical protein
LLFISGAAVGASVLAGCGGIDCAETATCLDTSDSAPPEDHSIDETSVVETGSHDGGDAAPDGDATLADGDAAPDGQPDGDAGAEDASDGDAANDGGDAHDGGDASDAADARDADAGSDADASDGCVAAAHEDCTNGKDDNCNGLVDCADPDCTQGQSFACVPAWPNGWIAPVAFYDNGGGPPAPTPPPCGAPYTVDSADGHITPVAGADPCSCSCGGVTGVTCSSPFVALYTSNQSCTNPAAFSGSVSTTCGQLANQGGINSAQMADAGVPSGGSCGTVTNLTPPAWNSSSDWARSEKICTLPTQHAYLTAPQNGCDAGQFCAEVPAITFNSKACVYSPGQPSQCPAGYMVKTTFFDAGTDTRSCSGTCQCGAPTGVSCGTRVTLLAGSCASGTNPQTLADTTCKMLSNYGGSAVSASMTQTITGGSCAVTSSPTPAGGIVTTGPVTVCCPP